MLGWLRRHGVYTGPKLYHDSLRMVSDRMQQLEAPGHSGEAQQVADLAAKITHESPLEVIGGGPAPDLIGKLQRQLKGETHGL